MPHTIDPVTDYVAGDSIEIFFTVTSDDISDLTGVSANWWLLDDEPHTDVSDSELDAAALLDDSDNGVSVSVNGSASEITVTIDKAVTTDLAGYHHHVLRAEGSSQGRETWGGRFVIERP